MDCSPPAPPLVILQARISGLPCPLPGDLPNPGFKPRFPVLQTDSVPSEPSGKPMYISLQSKIYILKKKHGIKVCWFSHKLHSFFCLRVPWMEEPGRLQSMGLQRIGHDWATSFTFHFHALEKEMATHSSVLAWRISGMAEAGGLPSLGSHRVGHDWNDFSSNSSSTLIKKSKDTQKLLKITYQCGSQSMYFSLSK